MRLKKVERKTWNVWDYNKPQQVVTEAISFRNTKLLWDPICWHAVGTLYYGTAGGSGMKNYPMLD